MDLKIALSPKNSDESKKLLEIFKNLPEISAAATNLTLNISEKNLNVLEECIANLKEKPKPISQKCKALCKDQSSCHNKAQLNGYCNKHYFLYEEETKKIEATT